MRPGERRFPRDRALLGVALVAGGVVFAGACSASSPVPAAAPPKQAKATPAVTVAAAPIVTAAPVVSAPTAEATSEPAPPPAPEAPRLTSIGYISFIWRSPSTKTQYIGYVRNGQSIALKSTETVFGPGCPTGFYAVEPYGYICNDFTVTRTPDARFVKAARATDPVSGPFPYQYALSNGSPMYNRIPTKDEYTRNERTYGPVGNWRPLHRSVAAHGDLATFDPIPAKDEIPGFFLDGKAANADRMGLIRQTIPLGSMVSYTKTFEAEGRTWLLSVDQTLVPADRMRPFKPSAFHGVKLGSDIKLPLAWMRKSDKPKYKKDGDGVVAAGSSWAKQSFVQLTGQRLEIGKTAYLETAESDGKTGHFYSAEGDATVAEAKDKMPFGVDPDKKWIHVSVGRGTLIAYKGLTPVYATLISPGKGGLPVKGKSSLEAATTPLGTYNITFKDRAATMSPETGENRSFWIQDVPWTMYFDAPFAIHAAFWHERFGEPTSAGCVNASPIDAQWLFEWADPPVPKDWQGATGAGATSANGPTTAVVVQR